MHGLREIALDTETTGLDPASGHRVVEIGCVEMIGCVRTGNHFHTYLNPQRAMPREAENIHGLSDKFLADKPLFQEVAAAFLSFLGDAPLVIHNAQFDLKFINAELAALHLPQIPLSRATDTVLIARRMFPGSAASLDALCRRFAIDLSARSKHGALLDAELLADVYLELRGGRQSSLLPKERAASSATAASGAATPSDPSRPVMPVRHFPPTAQELAEHMAMRARLSNPLWDTIEA